MDIISNSFQLNTLFLSYVESRWTYVLTHTGSFNTIQAHPPGHFYRRTLFPFHFPILEETGASPGFPPSQKAFTPFLGQCEKFGQRFESDSISAGKHIKSFGVGLLKCWEQIWRYILNQLPHYYYQHRRSSRAKFCDI
ncbi:Hypothetical_protein [Hexamita inflata]|uniref:Hypothetical_protein n=1 Tax=Hexamita inflata TaxID=28002 RepID=A0ABP1GEH4_9EUKA